MKPSEFSCSLKLKLLGFTRDLAVQDGSTYRTYAVRFKNLGSSIRVGFHAEARVKYTLNEAGKWPLTIRRCVNRGLVFGTKGLWR